MTISLAFLAPNLVKAIDGHCRRATKKVIVDDLQALGITSVRAICADMRHQFGIEGEAASTL
jgi:hypothetical protein